MASLNRPVASSSTTPSEKVRQLWKAFERSVPNGRNVMEHRVSAAKVKADTEYSKMPNHLRVSATEHEDMKAKSVNKIRETYYDDVKVQWDTKLKKAGLKAEDWTDMTAEEMDAVATILNGGLDVSSDEDLVVVKNPVPLAPLPQTYSNFYQRPIAPSFSTSTRTSNVSSISTASTASSYAVVNPNEFHSGEEDDYFYPVTATSHDLTSDDDDGAIPSHHRGNPFGGWSSGDSLASSMHNSVESLSNAPFPRPLVSNYIQNTSLSRHATTRIPAEDENAKASSSKMKIRQPYIGPHLEDPNEPLSEADDFELFKMQTRMQKIVEFHQQAALAEIRLSIEIYKDRKASAGPRKEVSSRVVEHQKQMTELQKEKEDERKTTVKEERTKRRSELRSRPGRSNTIVAPVPSAPTNPSWLTDFQENVSSQLQSNFDLEKLLAEDPTKQQDSVEQYLQQMLLDPSTSPSSAHVPHDSFSYGQGYESAQNVPAPRWNMSSASLQSSASGSGSYFANQTQITRRPTSETRKQKGKPSPFGEDSDDSSDEDNSPPADILTQTVSPFMRANVVVADAFFESQFQDDPILAAALSRYSGNNESRNSPPMPSWGTKPTPQPPSAQSAWAAKEVRATPVASGWTRKKQVNNLAPQETSSQNSAFALPEQFEHPERLSSSMSAFSSNAQGRKPISAPVEPQVTWEQPEQPSSMMSMSMSTLSFNAKGKKPMSIAAPVEEQPIWEEPPKKQTPWVAPSTTLSDKAPPTPAAAAPTPPVVPPKAVKSAAVPMSAPAPVAPASKKTNKKQRQANKKNGGASAVVDEPESTPATTQLEVPEPVVEPPQQQPQSTSFFDEPLAPTPEPTSLISRMMPAIGRARKDSAPPAPFGWEDSAIATPRPASKIPAHLQTQQDAGGTSRPNLFKKFNTTESVLGGGASASARVSLDQNPTGTIKPSQWGSASTQAATSNNRSIWNVFGGPSPPTKTSQQAASLFGESSVHIPGGFDVNEHGLNEDSGGGGEDDGGGGGEEDEVETPQIWKGPASIWGKKVEKAPVPAPSPVQQQQQQKQPPTSAAAQRQRRMSEATSNMSASRNSATKAPVAVPVPVTQPQAIPTPPTGKKGARAKKNAKGKKVTMEEVPDEENDSRGGILPVDSKVLLLPANDASPSKVILEPKPSVAPRMFDSIISYGDDEDDEDAFSSPHAVTPSTAPSSPPDVFGDDARLAAAMKEIQESALRFERLQGGDGGGGGGAWGPANTQQQHDRWMPSAMSTASTASKAPVWGQPSKDKGKGKMTDAEESPKAPIHNLKRNKPATGWL